MKEITLLGGGKTANLCELEGEFWVTYKILPSVDPVSECGKVFIDGNEYRRRGAIALAKSNNVPIVSTESYATEPFPLEEIVKRFKIPYFTCTLSYMIAYAIYLGYEKIRLFGMDPPEEWEHKADKPRITYWLGVAKGLGIEYELTPGSKLWAIMQESVARQYRVSEFRNNLADAAFIQEAKKHGDPYCFVSGVGKNDVTVITTADGKEISRWHP